uniref:Uncharacterized protein n=1 Tax=Noctiluca scintillans TaxID=2966 RepID=A0A7S0ZT18_NOCSC
MAEQSGANVNQSHYFDSDRSYRKAVAAELIAALDEGCVWELAAKLQQMGRIKHDLPLRPGARQASNSRQQAHNLTLSTSVLPSQQSAEHSQQQQQQQPQQMGAPPMRR